MLAIVAPGQGAQTPGFLAPWLSEPAVADRLNWLGTVAGIDLAHYGTKADAETIRDTACLLYTSRCPPRCPSADGIRPDD